MDIDRVISRKVYDFGGDDLTVSSHNINIRIYLFQGVKTLFIFPDFCWLQNRYFIFFGKFFYRAGLEVPASAGRPVRLGNDKRNGMAGFSKGFE